MNVKALIASLESAPIGDGDLLGEPFRCLRYQRKFLRGAFAPGVMRAGLSLARGGGKTGLAAASREAVRRYGRPQAIAADRWQAGELEDGVRAAGLALPEPTWRGQGWKDGTVDVRLFRSAVLDGKVAAPVSLAMRAAFAEARVVADSAANEKLAKAGEGQHRRRGRDDLAAAIVLAVAEGQRREAARTPRRWRYRMAG